MTKESRAESRNTVSASRVGVRPKRTSIARARRAERPLPVITAASTKALRMKKTASLPNRA